MSNVHEANFRFSFMLLINALKLPKDFKEDKPQEFPGGPVVGTLHLDCHGPKFSLWSGNWDLASRMALPKKKKKQKINHSFRK